MQTKIKTFKDILAWQEGHKLVLLIYSITKSFPREELFGLTSQMQRAAVSITSNIAEGFGRHTYKDRSHFFYMAQGSMTEIKNQLIIAKDLSYISSDKYSEIEAQADQAHRLLQGLLKKTNQLSSLFLSPTS